MSVFHDAEVLGLRLNRQRLELELDIRLDSDRVITARFSEVRSVELFDFNHQNVLFDLQIEDAADGLYRIELQSTYGLHGAFVCRLYDLGGAA